MTEIAFPIKGWNTNAAQNAKPDGSSPDLLNVVPFDRDYILRGAVRAGTTKFTPTQLGGGLPVLLVQQVTLALDPTSIDASTQLVNETFTYANGDLNTVSGGNWTAAGAGFTTGQVAGNVAPVTSNHVIVQTPNNAYMRYVPSLSLGTAFIIKATASVSNAGNWDQVNLWFRLNAAGTNGVYLKFQRNGAGGVSIQFVKFNGAHTNLGTGVVLPAGSVVANTPFQIEMHVNGNFCTGWFNGVQVLSVQTITDFVGNSGIGMYAAFNAAIITIDDFLVYAGAPLASFRDTKVVAVSSGNIYLGGSDSMAIATTGTAALAQSIKPQMASFGGICYFVDSTSNLKTLNLTTQTVADLVVSTGTETATTLGKYTLAASWNGRIVLAASAAFPMNFVASRQNDPTDWDYSQTDEGAAFDGNASRAGAIGDPLNALMPWTDDVLVLGGDHTIYMVQGNIAAAGQIINVSEAVGTLGADCWDIDPSGNLYFAGTGGIYKMASGSTTPVNIASESVRKFFSDINRVTHYVVLTWDRDRNGLHINVTPANSGTATHLFFDATNEAFFPIQYPNTFGPLCAITYDGDGPEDRQFLMGCRDGYIRKADPTALDDDGTAITNYVYIGPLRPSGDGAISVLQALEVILGESPEGFDQDDFGVTVSVQAGTDGYRALTFPERAFSFTLSQRVARRKRMLQRLSGGTFFFKVTGVASKLWSLEKLVASFTAGGLQRRWATNQD